MVATESLSLQFRCALRDHVVPPYHAGLDPGRACPHIAVVGVERRGLVEIEVARLREERDKLAREWKQVPYLGLSIVTVAPIYWIWGSIPAFYAILCVPSLVATAYYLIGVRRKENRENIAELERQLSGWEEAEAATS